MHTCMIPYDIPCHGDTVQVWLDEGEGTPTDRQERGQPQAERTVAVKMQLQS